TRCPHCSRPAPLAAGVRAPPDSPLPGCCVNARLVSTGVPSGVTRVAEFWSPLASLMLTVLLRLDVPDGRVLFTWTVKTTEPVTPALSAPTEKVYVDPAPPLPDVSVQPGVLLERSATVLAGTVSVTTTPLALVPVPETMLPALL